MSTKTLRKRIALVAVSALGFGLVGAAPSNAAEIGSAVTGITAVAATANSGTTGSAQTVFIGVTTAVVAGTADARDTLTISGKVTGFPVGGGTLITAAAAADAAADGDANLVGAMTFSAAAGVTNQCIQTAAANGGSTLAATKAATAAGAGFCKFSFTPTVAGTYTITLWGEIANIGTINDNEASNTVTVTVGAPSSVVANQIPNSADATAGDNELAGVKVSSVGIETVQVSGRTGIQVGFAPQYRLTRNAGTITADDEVPSMVGRFATIAYSVTNPAGTAVTVVSAQGGATASASQAIAGLATPGLTSATANIARTQAISPTTGWPQKGSVVFFSAATAGTYTITAFHDADLNGLVSVGEATTTSTVVIAADALPSITMTTFGQSVPADAADNGVGHLVRISLRNGTLPASLGLTEVLTISGPTGTVIDRKSVRNANLRLQMDDNTAAAGGINAAGVATADSVGTRLTQANFDAAGNAYINVGNSNIGAQTLTASIAGGTAAGATGSGSFTVTDATTNPVTRTAANTNFATSFSNLTGVAFAGGAVARAVNDADVTKALNVAPNKALTLSVGYLVGATNATAVSKTYEALFTDTYGLVTGVVGATYDMKTSLGSSATTAATRVSFSVALPAVASTVSGTLGSIAVLQAQTDGTAATTTFTIAVALPVATAVVVDPASTTANTYTLRAAIGSTNALTATVMDQYGIAMSAMPMTAQVTAGRNTQLIVTPLITDATGKVTFSVTDTSVSTLLTSDTVVFTTLTNSLQGTVTINYAATLPVATVEITGAASEDVAPTVSTNAINTTTAGAAGTRVTMSALVKDANGATLPAGIAVTWSISGLPGTSAIWTDPTTGYNWATSYTNASGVAQTFVYAWATGTVTVSATAGGKTAATAGKINFVNTDTDARVVSATVVGNIITAKVVDRYGNAVKGVNLSATRTAGTGYFAGSASSGATGITGADGTVDFIVTGGDVTATVATTTLNFGQTSSAAGQVNGTAVTATGIGASLSPVGVQSVSVSVTGFVSATDAAIAANKATTDAAIAALKAQLDAAAAKAAADKASSDAAIAAAQAAAVAASKAAQDAAVEAATAAADAAAEATDAANAATDAANASAEAGDAATAAAQDAADAVAALSTQVSEMIDTLKKQITALTNLVIKIQKKVKA